MTSMQWWRTDFGEAEFQKLSDSFWKKRISSGVVTEEFEQSIAKILNVPYAVATTSGTAALCMAFHAAGLKAGDEVIFPDRTWVATVHAAYLLGVKPVFVDVTRDRRLIDVTQIEPKITSKTRAVVPVHLGGCACDMRSIRALAEQYQLLVVEDAAQALLSRNAGGYLGTQSVAGCFSFAMSKLVSTGQGGMVVTSDPEVYKRLTLFRWQGIIDPVAEQWATPGFNFKFNDLLASLGVVQLARAPEQIKAVIQVYQRYEQGLRDLPAIRLLPVAYEQGEVPLYVEIVCETAAQRDGLVRSFKEHEVPTRPFYPPLHKTPYFNATGAYPNSSYFHAQGIRLPSGPAQPMEDIDKVIQVMHQFYS